MFEAGNLIVCEGPDCDWAALIKLVNTLITDMIIISTLLAVAVFIYAGFLLLTSGGNESAKTKAKDMFGKVVKGYVVILAAWLIVYTITSILLKPGYTLL
jgi:hypothetical protein